MGLLVMGIREKGYANSACHQLPNFVFVNVVRNLNCFLFQHLLDYRRNGLLQRIATRTLNED